MWVGGVGEHLTSPSTCKHGGQSNNPGHGEGALIQHIRPKAVWHACMFVNHQVHDQVVLLEVDIGVGMGSCQQSTLNFLARHVCCVHNAAGAVATLLREVQAAILVQGKAGAHLHKLQYTCRAFLANHLHSLGIVQKRASHHGVLHMVLHGVRLVQHSTHTALGVHGAALAGCVLGHHCHGTIISHLQSVGEACNAAANDHEVHMLHVGAGGVGA
mmetsp:Transcript_28869/g.77761  ORF Transcript_28869/g.77761 Transcript_28869/m.77761 type:complete len:215 (+) Transcript_28869:2193-2837(+)